MKKIKRLVDKTLSLTGPREQESDSNKHLDSSLECEEVSDEAAAGGKGKQGQILVISSKDAAADERQDQNQNRAASLGIFAHDTSSQPK